MGVPVTVFMLSMKATQTLLNTVTFCTVCNQRTGWLPCGV